LNGKTLEMILIIAIVMSLVFIKFMPKLIRLLIAWIANFLYGILVHAILYNERKYGILISFIMMVIMILITIIALE